MESNVLVIAPLIIPFSGVMVCLLLGRWNMLQRWVALGAGALALTASGFLLVQNIQDGPQIYKLGGWNPPFGIVFVGDMLSSLFVFMSCLVMLAGILYVLTFHDKCGENPVFVPLFLMMQTGLIGAFLTGDLFTLFVFIELMVLSSVGLTAMSDDRLGLEAAIKYIFISGMGSLLLLLGIAAMYAAFGTLNLADMSQQIASVDALPFLALAAGIMLLCAFLLKSAVFPFHYWQPDFHTTAPTPVSAMLSSIVVKVGVYGIIRMETLLFVEQQNVLQLILLILGVIGIFFGSLSALQTYNGKRMLAFSTLGQVGFILVGIGFGTALSLVAAIIYAFNHALIKSSLLMLMGVIASWTKTKTANFRDLTGFGYKIPKPIGILFLLGALAIAGIPPMNGFISKLALVEAGVAAESWLPLFLAIGAGIFTSIYMIRAWQKIFQQPPITAENITEDETLTVETKEYGDSYLAPAILIILCVLLGLFAAPLVDTVFAAVQQITNPAIYINAVGLMSG